MDNYTREQILRMVEQEDVEFIRLQFTDMFGVLKNIAIPASRIGKAMDNQFMINASYIEGFDGDEQCDLYLYPDLATFTVLPWRPQQGKVARFICDLYDQDHKLYAGSPRAILKKVAGEAAAMGYELLLQPECEFFLFLTDDNGMPTNITHEQAGYMDTSPLDLGENARRDIVLTLEDMGYEIDSSRHEIAPAQHEIDFCYESMLATADKLMTFKMAVRTIAKRHGLHATFMPQPTAHVDGSGMHVNMRLFKNGKNAFYDDSDRHALSCDAYAFIAGILEHIQGISAIGNPLVNSYKRLITGFEAPFDITWSTTQRAALLRIPCDRGAKTTVELRSPDGTANPYLLFALCMAAGLDGIRRQRQPPKAVNVNTRKMDAEAKLKAGLQTLPPNLNEALKALEKDSLVRDVLGDDFVNSYLKSKRKEWESYMGQISQWELSQYLYRI